MRKLLILGTLLLSAATSPQASKEVDPPPSVAHPAAGVAQGKPALPSGGAGLTFRGSPMGAIIVNVVAGSPADRAGLKPGEVIEAVNGASIKGLDASAAGSLMRAQSAGPTLQIAGVGDIHLPPSAAAPPVVPAHPADAASQGPFVIGETTVRAVVDLLGRPTATSALGDGTQVYVYTKTKTHVKGTSFIPVVGLFASGAKSRMVMRTFTFGPDGVLKNYTTTDASADCNIGLFSAGCR